jgi:ribose transport system substrate-binding protein
MRIYTKRCRFSFVPPLAVLALLVSACGGTSAESDAGNGSTDIAAFENKLEALAEGTSTAPPTDSPAPAVGKKLVVVSLAQNLPAAATASEAAVEAADAIGWSGTILDGKGDSNSQLSAVRQAIAVQADAILLVYIDCATVQAGLSEAKEAGIKIAGLESSDCSDSKEGAPSLFDYVSTYQGKLRFPEFVKQAAYYTQVWNVVQSAGKAKTLILHETSVVTDKYVYEGDMQAYDECGSCSEPVVVEHTFADLGPALQQKVQQALLQNPGVNGVAVSSDGILTSGVLAAIKTSGEDFPVMGMECAEPNLDLIRTGQGQDACVGFSIPWEAWSAVDGLNRVFAGEDPYSVDQGNGLTLVDADHNLTESGPFEPPVDFRAAYEEAWLAGQ